MLDVELEELGPAACSVESRYWPGFVSAFIWTDYVLFLLSKE